MAIDQSPMIRAAVTGDVETLEDAISAGDDIEQLSASGCTPLIVASERGHVEVVNVLLKNNANFKTCTRRKDTALHWAAYKGHAEIVQALLQAGANPDAVGELGNRPIHLAAANGHTAVVKLLLRQGANAAGRNEYGNTAAKTCMPATDGHVSLSDMIQLPQRGKPGSRRGASTQSVWFNRLTACSLQASRNEYGNTPAMTAAQPDCKEALSAVIIGGESARLKMAEEIEAAAAEAEAAHLEEYMQKEESPSCESVKDLVERMQKKGRERQVEATRSAAQRRRAEEDAEEDRIEEEARQQRLAEEEAARQAEEARLKAEEEARLKAEEEARLAKIAARKAKIAAAKAAKNR